MTILSVNKFVKDKLVSLIELHNDFKDKKALCDNLYDVVVDYLHDEPRYTIFVPSRFVSDYNFFHVLNQEDGGFLDYLAMYCRMPLEQYEQLYKLTANGCNFELVLNALNLSRVNDIPPLLTEDGFEYVIDVKDSVKNLLSLGVLQNERIMPSAMI